MEALLPQMRIHEPDTETKFEQWATRQLADYDAGRPGTMFGEGHVLSVDEAYRLQSDVAELRQRRGERIIGYKVGCTSPKIRAQLGIEHPIAGRLFDSERYDSGAEVSRRRYANLAIEGELAVELSREPSRGDFQSEGLPDCVERVFPVIELHHHVLRGDPPTAGELISNNAIHAGFVARRGVGAETLDFISSLTVRIDGDLIESCDGPLLTATIRSSLQWLSEHVRRRGEQLATGQVVLTGSIPRLIPIDRDCHVRVDVPPLGTVEATVVS